MNCPDCGQRTGAPNWKAREYILWRNQHGQGVRVFCDACGAWNDITSLNSRPDTIENRRHGIVTPAHPQPPAGA